jgi:hypothetical protein
MKRACSTSILALALAAGPALAGELVPLPPTTTIGNDDTSLFAGLNWTFGPGGGSPEGVLGVIYSEVDAGGDLTGGLLSFNIGFAGGGNPPDIRLAGFAGSDDVAGQLGLGINLDGSGLFGLGGFLTNYGQGGLTFSFDGDIGGFLGIHSYEFVEPEDEVVNIARPGIAALPQTTPE